MSVLSDMDKSQENNQLEQPTKFNQCPLNRVIDSLIQSSSTSLLAGLATATHLNSHKIPFLLLEASDAVGRDGQRRSSLHPSVSLLFSVLSHSQSKQMSEQKKKRINKEQESD
jgi:hypothetical protein